MTDNQFNQLFDLVTKSVTGVQRVEKDISEIKSDIVEMKGDIVEMKGNISEMKGDISELKDGQKRIENQMRLNNRVVNEVAGEQMRLNDRVLDLEQASI